MTMGWRFEYPANVEPDGGGFFLVTFPDFPEAATDARSRERALAEAVDCLEEAVAGRIKRGDALPTLAKACLVQRQPEHSPVDLTFGSQIARFRLSDSTNIHEQPLVAPQVSHLRQVPLRTSVKLPHSAQLSPS
jgi:predicted RNase H-like HicB family nuclease